MRHANFKQIIGTFFLLTFIAGNFSAFGQTRRAPPAPSKLQTASDQTKEKSCAGGYNGSVNYTKTTDISSSGKFGSYAKTKRVYQANVVVRDDGRQNGSATMSPDGGVSGSFNLKGAASTSENETNEQMNNSEGETSCDLLGKNKKYRKCTSNWIRRTDTTGAGEANVYVALRGRLMHVGLSELPKTDGTTSETSKSSCTGTCTPDKPINSSRSVEVRDAGEKWARTEEDEIAFNPQSFNRLSGSWTKTEPTPGGTATETITWNLSRCAPPLEIAEVRFEHKRVPNPNQWFGVDPVSGTIDGNLVRIKAKVVNNGGDTAYANVKFSELKSGEELPDGTISVAVKPGEARDVEYEWDTNGFAWNENQKAESVREIKAEIEGDSKTERIKILPKPVILVHGLWSNAAAWAEYPGYLREAHSFAWEGYAVGADPYVAQMSTGDHPGNYEKTNTIFQNAQELGKQIKWAREQKNAWHVDVVAHSMGGLISRQYINAFMAPVFDNKPEIAHLVMLGTPNQGSPCADLVGDVFEFFEQRDMNAMRELRPSVVADLNSRTTNRKGVKFSILIGYAIPQTCQTEVRGDGVVPIMSARYNIHDRDYVFRDHISLTDDANFKSFVMPRIAVGPKKAKAERTTAWLENKLNDNHARFDAAESNGIFRRVSFKSAADGGAAANSPNVTTRRKVALPPKQTKEIEIPAGEGKTGVLVIASTAVVATLTDGNGALVGKSEGGMDAMKNPFRIIGVDRNPAGNLKLKLENFDAKETIVFVAGFTGNAGEAASFTVEAGKPNAAGKVSLLAKWVENNSPVTGAKVTGRIAGLLDAVEFFDDGKHGDAAANDGIYGASVGKSAAGESFVEVTAEANNQTKVAVAQITGGAAANRRK